MSLTEKSPKKSLRSFEYSFDDNRGIFFNHSKINKNFFEIEKYLRNEIQDISYPQSKPKSLFHYDVWKKMCHLLYGYIRLGGYYACI